MRKHKAITNLKLATCKVSKPGKFQKKNNFSPKNIWKTLALKFFFYLKNQLLLISSTYSSPKQAQARRKLDRLQKKSREVSTKLMYNTKYSFFGNSSATLRFLWKHMFQELKKLSEEIQKHFVLLAVCNADSLILMFPVLERKY